MNLYKNEAGYMALLQQALVGQAYNSRAGKCHKVFDSYLEFDELPIQTVRKQGVRGAWSEMLMFMSGDPDTTQMSEAGFAWWDAHTSREFLDSRGLSHLPEGSLGKSYSYQWRHPENDQLQTLVDSLNNDPFSRRIAIDLWNVSDHGEMPLLPCWYRSNWFTTIASDGKYELNMRVDSRSCDLLFGFWQAALQYALLQQALVTLLGWRWKVGKTAFMLLDAHVYENQQEYVLELLRRALPARRNPIQATLREHGFGLTVDNLLAIKYEDWIVENRITNNAPMTTPRPAIAI